MRNPWKAMMAVLVLAALAHRVADVVLVRWGIVPLAVAVVLLVTASLGSRGWR